MPAKKTTTAKPKPTPAPIPDELPEAPELPAPLFSEPSLGAVLEPGEPQAMVSATPPEAPMEPSVNPNDALFSGTEAALSNQSMGEAMEQYLVGLPLKALAEARFQFERGYLMGRVEQRLEYLGEYARRQNPMELQRLLTDVKRLARAYGSRD